MTFEEFQNKQHTIEIATLDDQHEILIYTT